ncbi:sf-assemblin [Cryptosporidium canis]|uniref:Sf-assemblin n=1 Tax=Cryptosporidium canis TaxID=195482 RepID=A0ABQ8P818_9CRYT|nr:sf-assemblin [Cryptosporidium canis]KAJ1612110.1 sf-assemblin [Cryptosporidium canis]
MDLVNKSSLTISTEGVVAPTSELRSSLDITTCLDEVANNENLQLSGLNNSQTGSSLSPRNLQLSLSSRGIRHGHSNLKTSIGKKSSSLSALFSQQLGGAMSNLSSTSNASITTTLSPITVAESNGSGILHSPASIMGNSSLPLSTKQKLGQIQGQLLGLEKQLRNDTRQKREYEESRLQVLKENTMKLKKAIETENQQRNEAQSNMKRNFEEQISSIQQRLEDVFSGKLDQLSIACQSLDERLSIIEKEMVSDKSQIVEEFEHKHQSLVNEVMNAKSIAEREYNIAEEKEEQIKLFLKELESHVEEEINREVNNKEIVLNSINDSFNQLKEKIEKTQDKFQNFVLEEIAHIKNDIAKESQNREAADDDIVQALNQYTKALQDVLKIIC